MRNYVKQKERLAFHTEARRQSLAIAERSRDPRTDDYASLRELDALFDADISRLGDFRLHDSIS